MNLPTIVVSERKIKGDAIKEVIEYPDRYQHEAQAFGGYWEAQFSFAATRSKMDEWISDGLGRHVEVYAPSLDKIWEGVVDEVQADVGPLKVKRGSLLDATNDVWLYYSVNEENSGGGKHRINGNTALETASHAASQAVYGIIRHAVNASDVTTYTAADQAATYLEANAWPKSSDDVNSRRSSTPGITVKCKGYVHWMEWPAIISFYGPVATGTKIIQLLAYEPNAWLAWDTAGINAGPVTENWTESGLSDALSVIRKLVAIGSGPAPATGPANWRWNFGVYDDLKCFYQPIPQEIAYEAYLEDERFALRTASTSVAGVVPPWSIRPDHWMILSDFLVGRTIPGYDGYWQDPRPKYIESVKYVAPYDFQLKCGDADTVYQALARMGLGGIS